MQKSWGLWYGLLIYAELPLSDMSLTVYYSARSHTILLFWMLELDGVCIGKFETELPDCIQFNGSLTGSLDWNSVVIKV